MTDPALSVDAFCSFRLCLSLMEAAVIEYYAAQFKKYTSQIVRGLIQRAAADPSIDLGELRAFARQFELMKSHPDMRHEVRHALSRLELRREGNKVSLTDETTRPKYRSSSAWERDSYRLRLTGFEAFMCAFWASKTGLGRETIVRHLIWELASSDANFDLSSFVAYAQKAATGRPLAAREKLDQDLQSLQARRHAKMIHRAS
jgi:hypothetical protein